MRTGNRSILTILLFFLFVLVPAGSQCELLIIAPDEFIDELQPLKRFKEASGRPTIVLSLTQIYNSSFCNGADQAEEIKRCIAYYEEHNNVEYVILMGDVDRVPVRWRWWGLPGQQYWGVSDLYYADLYKKGTRTFDSWDSNGNGLYGEIEFATDRTINNDHIDFLPDVAVGRVPASSGAEVSAYVKKVIAYETNTNPSDAWFRTAALYTGCWDSWDNVNKDEVGKSLKNSGSTVLQTSSDQRIRYGHWLSPCPPSPAACCEAPLNMPGTVVNDLNNGAGFANYIGHGNVWGWADLGFSNTQLSNLSNAGKLPVAFAASCDTGMFARMARFAPYKDINAQGHCGTDNGENLPPGTYPYVNLPRPAPLQDGAVDCDGDNVAETAFDRWCFAEDFIFGSPTGSSNGAIAYLGERTNGRQWSRMLDRFFFQAYDTGGHEILGDMWKYMIEEYHKYYDLANADKTWPHSPADWDWGHRFDEPQKMILFGDPSLQVGGAFKTNIYGQFYDGVGGPMTSYSRYRVTCDNDRITCNVTVPAGERLTAQPSSSILFEHGRKITAMDSSTSNGFVVNGKPDKPVGLLGLSANTQTAHLIRGIVVRGQLRLRNGGAIKFQ